MARIASVAVGGYFPTPKELLPRIAAHLSFPEGGQCLLDPCAGDGEAVFTLAELLRPSAGGSWGRPVYAVEMEKTRHKALENRSREIQGWQGEKMSLHGDAFRAEFKINGSNRGATVLFLNPPYDLDPVHGRLEEKFLDRYTRYLANDGVLVFLVPFYALKASARTLATHYRNLTCFRFPGASFDVFKQVVLFANKRIGGVTDPEVVALVEGWAADASAIPELEETPAGPVATAHPHGRGDAGFESATMNRVDLGAMVEAFKPWHLSDKAGRAVVVEGVIPTVQVGDLLERTYPLAMPPKPAHIATGVAAGIFNGAVIAPDDAATGLPRLLLKGCFDKDWKKVEEKTDKRGNVTAEVQVQAPKLVVTVLDLSTKKYHTLSSTPSPTFARDVSSMTTADLLAHYGGAMMNVLLKQCPVAYDPADTARHFPLPTLGRPLYKAQEHVVRAAVTLLGGPKLPMVKRAHKTAFILGEIGSGKSTIALATLRTIGARSTLILCPPHLLDSWKEQVQLTLPGTPCAVLNTVEDVMAYAAEKPEGQRVAILSRETAKLGHAMVGVPAMCPRCHGPVGKAEDLASKRARCGHRPLLPQNDLARLALQLGTRVSTLSELIRDVLPYAVRRRVAAKPPTDETKAAQIKALRESGVLFDVLAGLLQAVKGVGYQAEESLATALVPLGLMLGDGEELARLVKLTWAVGSQEGSSPIRNAAMAMALAVRSDLAEDVIAFLREHQETEYHSWHHTPPRSWRLVEQARENMAQQKRPEEGQGGYASIFTKWTRDEVGAWGWCGNLVGSTKMMIQGFLSLKALGSWKYGKECGEHLYQSDPDSFRRVPLAGFIAKRYRSAFDTLILDEIQEYATDGSAQERAAHLLTEVGWPTLMLTGTISNGYASSLFTNTWATDRLFRQEFDRGEVAAFMDRYGYRKRVVQDKDKETGDVVAFGTVTDRVERSARMTGYAPGVLPLFVYRYLLKKACVIHKTDARGDIPEMTEHRVAIEPAAGQRASYDRLLRKLVERMRKDQFTPDLAGKLFGALSELPSYLDRCSRGIGNQEDGTYAVKYPDEVGGAVIDTGASYDPLDLLPKEEWMVETVRETLAAGENVMIFGWHTNLLARLKGIIERECGVEAPILDPAKVPTAKRQAWIEKEIVKKGRRVLICNPTTVQTGLNNLVHFSRIIVMENPACNPIIYRQAIGRIDRIGQTRPTRVYFPLYKNTLQEAAHRLLLLKVAVSRATDGLDAEGALMAAGVGDADALTSLSVGRALAEWLKQREDGLVLAA